MIAAIYARKSTDQEHEIPDLTLSLDHLRKLGL